MKKKKKRNKISTWYNKYRTLELKGFEISPSGGLATKNGSWVYHPDKETILKVESTPRGKRPDNKGTFWGEFNGRDIWIIEHTEVYLQPQKTIRELIKFFKGE